MTALSRRIRAGIGRLIDLAPAAMAAIVFFVAVGYGYSAFSEHRSQLLSMALLLGLLSVGLWRTKLVAIAITCCLLGVIVPFCAYVENSPVAFLDYEHRWDKDGVEKFSAQPRSNYGRMAPIAGSIALVLGAAGIRELQRRGSARRAMRREDSA